MILIIDANMYWLPQTVFTNKKIQNDFIRSIPKQYGIFAEVVSDDEIIIEKPIGYPGLNYNKNDYLLENQLKKMDECKIDLGILKLPGCQEWLTLDMCKLFNDELAKHIKESKGRLSGLGVVPPYDDDDVFQELLRIKNELKLPGIQLSAHYGNYYLDDKQFRPFLKKVNELKLPVYVHHTPVPVEFNSLYQYDNLRRSIGRNIDQLTAISREVFSDLFEECPDLILIHSMLGGGIGTYLNSLFPLNSGNGRFNSNNVIFKKHFKENIFLEMSHAQPWGKEALEFFIKELGSLKVIYGSSFPVNLNWFNDGEDFIKVLNITKEDINNILFENAKKLYRLNIEGGSFK